MQRIARKIMLASMVVTLGIMSLAVMYSWTDDEGNRFMTDRVEKLPDKYRALLRYDGDRYATSEGVGYEKDRNGNYKFYDHSSPATRATKRKAPSGPPAQGLAGAPVSPEQYQEIKAKYARYGGEPVPEVDRFRVKRALNPDTFEIDNGQKVSYIGIDFPGELGPETKIYKEVMAYQKRLIEGKTVALLYGPQRYDDKGRMLAYVFIGTDMFVNADLVMNGYAKVSVVEPNTEYQVLFGRLETFAKKSMLGIWNDGEDIPGAEAMDRAAR